jgi:hypothetical protein
MLFGSAVVLAFLLGTGAARETKRQTTHLWLHSEARPKPLRLEPMSPVDLRSLKIVGASGVGAFVSVGPGVALGAGITSMKLGPDHRAFQTVAAVRFKF